MDDLLTLLDYHAWATARTLRALEPLTPGGLGRDLGSSHGGIGGTALPLFADLPALPTCSTLAGAVAGAPRVVARLPPNNCCATPTSQASRWSAG